MKKRLKHMKFWKSERLKKNVENEVAGKSAPNLHDEHDNHVENMSSMPMLFTKKHRRSPIDRPYVDVLSVVDLSGGPYKSGAYGGKFDFHTFVQSTLHEFFQEHWCEWKSYFTENMLLMAALENLLLYMSLNESSSIDDYEYVSSVLRVRCGLNKSTFLALESALQVGSEWMTEHSSWEREKIFASFRLLLLCDSVALLRSSEDIVFTKSWFERQVVTVVTSLLALLYHESDEQQVDVVRRNLLESAINFCACVECALEEKSVVSLDKLDSSLEEFLKQVRKCDTCTPLAHSNHPTHSVPLVPFPLDLRCLLFMCLVYTCYEEVDVDSDDDSDDDDIDEVVRVHHGHARTLDILERYSCTQQSFRVPSTFVRLCFLRVLIDVVMEQVMLPTVTAIDVLADDESVLRLLKEEGDKFVCNLDERGGGSDARFALVTSRLEEWCVGSLWSALCYVHFASPAPHVVTTVIHVFAKVLSCVEPSIEPGTEVARAYFCSASVQFYHWQLKLKNDWHAVQNCVVKLVTQVFDSGHKHENPFSVTVDSECPQFFVAGFILELCAHVTRIVKRELNKQNESEVVGIVQIVKQLQVLMVEQESVVDRVVMETVLERSIVQVEDACGAVLKRMISVKSDRLDELRQRCVHMDQWVAISDKNTHSSSVLDLFRILNSIQDNVFRFMDRMAPFGVYELHYLLVVVENAVIKYSRTVLESCGQVQCVSSYERVDDAREVAPNFTSQGIMEHLLAAPDKRSKPLSHIDRMKKQASMLYQSLQSLCVRVSCLVVADTELNSLMNAILKKWEHFDKVLRVSRETHPILHEYLPESPDIPDADRLFARAFRALTTHTHNIRVYVSVQVVHHELFDVFHQKLYRPQASVGTNLNATLTALDDVMATLYHCLPEAQAGHVAKLVYAELASAWKWLVLHGDGELLPVHAPVLEADVLEMCELFFPELGAETVAHQYVSLCRVVKAVERDTEELMALLAATNDNNNTTQNSGTVAPPLPIEREHIALLLRRRGRRGEKFARKHMT